MVPLLALLVVQPALQQVTISSRTGENFSFVWLPDARVERTTTMKDLQLSLLVLQSQPSPCFQGVFPPCFTSDHKSEVNAALWKHSGAENRQRPSKSYRHQNAGDLERIRTRTIMSKLSGANYSETGRPLFSIRKGNVGHK